MQLLGMKSTENNVWKLKHIAVRDGLRFHSGTNDESPVAAEFRSMPHHWSQTSWPHYAGAVSAALASCSAVSGVQTRLSGAPRHCAVKCLRTWLMISISSPKAIDDPFGLPLITCVRCQLRRQKFWRCQSANLEQSAMWPANIWHQLQPF